MLQPDSPQPGKFGHECVTDGDFINASVTAATLTTEELFALPDDGVERDLIRGELKAYAMTKPNRRHSEVMMAVGDVLRNWL